MPVQASTSFALSRGRAIVCSQDHRIIRTCHHRSFLSPQHHQKQTTLCIETPSWPPISISQKVSRRLAFVAKAADSTQTTSSATKSIVPDEEFSLAKVSFGVIGLGTGITLLSYGFGAYFNVLPGSEWSALMLTYGFPLAIIGMALKYAELKPVPCLTYSDAQMLREKCATPILKQVRNDVTRYRYGDEQHLDEALKRIFQYGLVFGDD